MIEIESYLRDGDGRFTRIEEVHDAPANPRHVEGALVLRIDGVAIPDTAEWDDVDQLWAYISTMVGELSEQNEVSTYFPGQPIKLTFRRQGNGRMLVSVDQGKEARSASASERELVAALQSSGAQFFARMSELSPEYRVVYDNVVAHLMSYRTPESRGAR